MATTTLTGKLLDPTGSVRSGEYIYFRVLSVGTDDGASPEETYPRDTVEGLTDASGLIKASDGTSALSLWVNGDSDVDCVYEIRFQDGQTVDVIVPTAAGGGTIDIATLISTHQANGSSTQQSSVYNAAIDRTNHTGGPDDLNGEEIILDVDGDTSITADTDDQIDFKIGGVDELTLTAAKADNLDDIAALTPSDEAVLRGNGTDWVIATTLKVDAGSNNTGIEMGIGNSANGFYSVAEGNLTTASGDASHAEGNLTTASGNSSHAEGRSTTASGDFSHAEGGFTTASGNYSSATGYKAQAIHDGARVEADSQNADVSSTTTDQFTARFQNGYEFKGGDATFEADVTAVDGTFSGNTSAVNGTFSGTLGVTGAITGTSATLTGKTTASGGFATSTTSVTAITYTALVTDSIILVDDDTAAAAVTVTLPAAATAGDGFNLVIKKLGTTGNVTVDGNASETIDGSLTTILTAQYESLTIACDGSNWHIL